ncbi:MAG: Camelysin metallo-endopeptidase [Solirubrobacteraceae bacterium]|nr:Camelysin metallo-endopeptidase [Solirubrobacteraceae bacterium]
MSSRLRSATAKKLAATVAILAAVGVFVSFGVFSAFSDTQSNTSSLKTATFGLTQTPASGLNSLLQAVLDLVPGDTITRCVQVANSGNVPATVTVAPSMTDVASGTLSTVETLALDRVDNVDTTSASTISSCTPTTGHTVSSASSIIGAVAGHDLAGSYALPGKNAATWAAGESNVYRIVLSLPSGVTSALAGNQVSTAINFVANQVAGAAR